MLAWSARRRRDLGVTGTQVFQGNTLAEDEELASFWHPAPDLLSLFCLKHSVQEFHFKASTP